VRVLAFAASLRHDSLNRKLIAVAAGLASDLGAEVDKAEMHEFTMPLFDGDFDAGSGRPEGAQELCRRVRAADAIILASPEYNYSIPGILKNAIDWVSRERPMPWRGKSVYLMSASPSPMGGIRGLWQTRIPLEGCGAMVFPDMFALPHANHAFDDQGQLVNIQSLMRLKTELTGFLRLAEAVIPIVGECAPPERQRSRQEIDAALEEQTELQSQPSH
jgi:NAD(P)H-dependent FMN reductase